MGELAYFCPSHCDCHGDFVLDVDFVFVFWSEVSAIRISLCQECESGYFERELSPCRRKATFLQRAARRVIQREQRKLGPMR